MRAESGRSAGKGDHLEFFAWMAARRNSREGRVALTNLRLPRTIPDWRDSVWRYLGEGVPQCVCCLLDFFLAVTVGLGTPNGRTRIQTSHTDFVIVLAGGRRGTAS